MFLLWQHLVVVERTTLRAYSTPNYTADFLKLNVGRKNKGVCNGMKQTEIDLLLWQVDFACQASSAACEVIVLRLDILKI